MCKHNWNDDWKFRFQRLCYYSHNHKFYVFFLLFSNSYGRVWFRSKRQITKSMNATINNSSDPNSFHWLCQLFSVVGMCHKVRMKYDSSYLYIQMTYIRAFHIQNISRIPWIHIDNIHFQFDIIFREWKYQKKYTYLPINNIKI